ncbi:MAG: hypothetical protein UV48_C0005G0017 [Candidatus Azambacteria bacterium GW2011_GWA2_42_9]|uniref:Uncharacterized protein n=4 Tax=Candidatus Azamiibacteriota TaxID=1752741 RepID=A0A0G0ZB74_9BACT|nr:MAG: hypothetical protein UV07_C0016G0002 [Candidatus Azambacteria bacterium GW2011_GWB1_42_17]KKS45962.1 MAG: hypothetical protein UV10_C0010G0002 [Candidatus Azambacteria bacterium GW2011_GWA1_42_19]KKS75891.1 MAG: hypothetical protein UV48_C0005G0017 [Candidatus Azambacteria bacterium GW2011_GWA2_42_9]
MEKKHSQPWKILLVLALIGLIWIFIADDKIAVIILMAVAYLNNVSYSMVSRSAVRDNAPYHAFTVLLSNVLWYSTLNLLIKDDMTIILFVPYTVATVWGSFTGAVASMKVEKVFGITTNVDKKKASAKSALVQKVLLVFLAIFGIIVAIYAENFAASLKIASLVFVNSIAFSILRRSRNTNNTIYHIIASIVNSIVWYLLYRDLALTGMTFVLFTSYCFGSVLGGLTGQKTSSVIERQIGATADKHLEKDGESFSYKEILTLIPKKTVITLTLVATAFAAFQKNHSFLLILTAFSAAQQIAFSMVSRSRNRDSMIYHVIASIFSNGVWFLTFRQLHVKNWTPELYVPYAAGGAVGSVTGVAISMGIEKKLHITSET